MALRMSDAGGQRFLNILFNQTAKDATFTINLFCGATPPSLADADTPTTFEAPTGGVGEAAITTLTNAAGGSFGTTVSLNGSNIPQVAWPQQTWTFTGALTNTNKIVQGYSFTTGSVARAGTLLWEELLSTPVTPANGVSLSITPTFLAGNGTPS